MKRLFWCSVLCSALSIIGCQEEIGTDNDVETNEPGIDVDAPDTGVTNDVDATDVDATDTDVTGDGAAAQPATGSGAPAADEVPDVKEVEPDPELEQEAEEQAETDAGS